ncbi:MAG: YgaP family membrane protein [Pseudobdellovibrionaceae bacterium]
MKPQFIRTHMHLNIHPLERWLRIIAGVVLVLLAFPGGYINVWYLLGVLPLLTGIVGFCPVYYFLGINTNRWARVKVDRNKK